MDELKETAEKLAELLRKRGEHIERLAKDPVPEVTRHDLEEALKKKASFLFFTADWCGPCISFLETFRSIALEYSTPEVFFGRVDVDRSPSIPEKYNIEKIPSIAVFINGKLVDVIIGSMSKEALKRRIESYLKRIE
ncbi:MAG: thioredoxin family protein [Desulfurococcales archaeon]|nr:thioredoxin family protein [Desulfurococcales archaeon]MEB3788778.1 thioredoxin family protein [Desulfurococcales archaeon]